MERRISDLDPEILVFFKGLRKRDARTKKKSLRSIIYALVEDLPLEVSERSGRPRSLSPKPSDGLSAKNLVKCEDSELGVVTGEFVEIYPNLCTDLEREVRSLSNRVLQALLIRRKKVLAPFLRVVLPSWIAAQHDPAPEVRLAARDAFCAAFSEPKREKVIQFGATAILANSVRSLKQTLESVSLPGFTAEQSRETYELVICGGLSGARCVLESFRHSAELSSLLIFADVGEPVRRPGGIGALASAAEGIRPAEVEERPLSELSSSLFRQNVILKLVSSKFVRVRVATYELLSTLWSLAGDAHVGRSVFCDDAEYQAFAKSIFKSFGEDEQSALQPMIEAFLAFVKAYPDCWAIVRVSQFLPRFFTFLKRSCSSLPILYDAVLPLVAVLPMSELQSSSSTAASSVSVEERLVTELGSGIEVSQSPTRGFSALVEVISFLSRRSSPHDLFARVGPYLLILLWTTPLSPPSVFDEIESRVLTLFSGVNGVKSSWSRVIVDRISVIIREGVRDQRKRGMLQRCARFIGKLPEGDEKSHLSASLFAVAFDEILSEGELNRPDRIEDGVSLDLCEFVLALQDGAGALVFDSKPDEILRSRILPWIERLCINVGDAPSSFPGVDVLDAALRLGLFAEFSANAIGDVIWTCVRSPIPEQSLTMVVNADTKGWNRGSSVLSDYARKVSITKAGDPVSGEFAVSLVRWFSIQEPTMLRLFAFADGLDEYNTAILRGASDSQSAPDCRLLCEALELRIEALTRAPHVVDPFDDEMVSWLPLTVCIRSNLLSHLCDAFVTCADENGERRSAWITRWSDGLCDLVRAHVWSSTSSAEPSVCSEWMKRACAEKSEQKRNEMIRTVFYGEVVAQPSDECLTVEQNRRLLCALMCCPELNVFVPRSDGSASVLLIGDALSALGAACGAALVSEWDSESSGGKNDDRMSISEDMRVPSVYEVVIDDGDVEKERLFLKSRWNSSVLEAICQRWGFLKAIAKDSQESVSHALELLSPLEQCALAWKGVREDWLSLPLSFSRSKRVDVIVCDVLGVVESLLHTIDVSSDRPLALFVCARLTALLRSEFVEDVHEMVEKVLYAMPQPYQLLLCERSRWGVCVSAFSSFSEDWERRDALVIAWCEMLVVLEGTAPKEEISGCVEAIMRSSQSERLDHAVFSLFLLVSLRLMSVSSLSLPLSLCKALERVPVGIIASQSEDLFPLLFAPSDSVAFTARRCVDRFFALTCEKSWFDAIGVLLMNVLANPMESQHRGVFLCWDILTRNLGGLEKSDVVALCESWIESKVFFFACDRMSEEIVSSLAVAERALERPEEATTVVEVASVVFSQCCGRVPALVRVWFNDHCSPHALKQVILSFTKSNISVRERKRQLMKMREVVERERLSCRVREDGVLVSFSSPGSDECVLEVPILLPAAFPLQSVEIESPTLAAVDEKKWRKFLFMLTVLTQTTNDSLAEIIITWKENVDSFFNGLEECPICYCVVDYGSKKLPTFQCAQCKNKFHLTCIRKWIKTNKKADCPMCRFHWPDLQDRL